MSTLIMEESRPIEAFHPDDGSYTAYPTTTVNVQIKGLQIPPPPDGWDVCVHVGLARHEAEHAEVGIISVAKVGLGPSVTFDPWETAAYGQILGFTVGAYARHGAMRGWWLWQLWKT